MADEDEFELHARHGDPSTSHASMAALDRNQMAAAVDCVVRLFREQGPLADFQLREAFDRTWTAPCCDHLYQQARSCARDKGLVRDTGVTIVNPATRRHQIVWAACETPVVVTVEKCPTCGHVLGRTEKPA